MCQMGYIERLWGFDDSRMCLKWCGDLKNCPETGDFLRDEIGSGRGVHRKMGVLIQKSRSLFRGKMGNLRIFGILGVGVV